MPFPSFPLFIPCSLLVSLLVFLSSYTFFLPFFLCLFLPSSSVHLFLLVWLVSFLPSFLSLFLPSFQSSPFHLLLLTFFLFYSFFSGCLHPSFLPNSNTDLWHACTCFVLLWTMYEWSYVGRVDIWLGGAEQWNLDVMTWPSSGSAFFFYSHFYVFMFFTWRQFQ